jgi:hypothetical protein
VRDSDREKNREGNAINPLRLLFFVMLQITVRGIEQAYSTLLLEEQA